MVTGAEIGAAFGGLKTALDVLKGLKSTADAVAINDAKIALQGAIIEAQTGLMAAQDAKAAHLKRIEELEQEIMRLKDWSAESERYEAVDIHIGTIAYMPKLGMENGEPPHWLCASCFQHRQKSFLAFKGQDQGKNRSESTWGCDACKASIKVFYRVRPDRTQEQRVAAAASSGGAA